MTKLPYQSLMFGAGITIGTIFGAINKESFNSNLERLASSAISGLIMFPLSYKILFATDWKSAYVDAPALTAGLFTGLTLGKYLSNIFS